MELNLQQIRAAASGAEKVTQENCAFRFFRFNDEQIAEYEKNNADFLLKCFSSAGIKLCFKTNSDELSFVYDLKKGSSRTYGKFDLYVNGSLTDHFGKDFCTESSDNLYSYRLPEGENLVELYLPWSKRTDIRFFRLNDGATFIPVKRGKKTIAFGDSITHGYDADYPSLSYVEKVARYYDAEIYNKAIGGDKFFPSLAAIKESFVPDYITVAYGTNDWCSFDLKTIEERCEKFYSNLNQNFRSSEIFALMPTWRAARDKSKTCGIYIEEMDSIIRKICERVDKRIHVIDCFDFVPHCSDFFSDGELHPNDMGFALYAENLLRAMDKNFSAKRGE